MTDVRFAMLSIAVAELFYILICFPEFKKQIILLKAMSKVLRLHCVCLPTIVFTFYGKND